MLACCGLQLAFHQALQVCQALCLVEQSLQRPRLAQQNGWRACSQGRKAMVGYLRLQSP